ncbi:MAG: iron ABC transporter permease [Thermonemataceae bacterium]|nr:iron ABC transporter permease [Thermonemataceae bacterium]
MSNKKKIFLLLFILAISFIADLYFGAIHIDFYTFLNTLIGRNTDNFIHKIIFVFRLPKALTAILVGMALSVAGLLMQTFFSNPLASPSELGVSSGASLGVASFMLSSGLVWGEKLAIETYYLIIFLAVIGAVLVMLLMIALSSSVRQMSAVLIIGLMLNSLVLAVLGFWQFLSSPEQIRDFLWWSFGSLQTTNYPQILIMTFMIAGIFFWIFFHIKNLNALLIGERYAQTMGVKVSHLRWQLIIWVGVLAGLVTAFCGPIGFVGLAVPHLSRALLRTANHRLLLPFSALMGAIILLCCDMIASNIYGNFVLPINIITALFGSPVVIWIIMKRRF